MKIISHRGNLDGPRIYLENHPSYIDKAIMSGFEVEVDIRYLDNKFWLGHDEAQYEITIDWVEDRKSQLYFHCKDLTSAYKLNEINNVIKFCHTSDPYTLVSNNTIWVHDLTQLLNDTCIIPLLDINDIDTYINHYNIYGICTDYPNKIKSEII
jgi:hypothetical protein